jgi:hypothetical protein
MICSSSGMKATAASSNATILSWTDGLSNWVVIADLGVGMDAYSDAGLDAATQYFYRVSAHNNSGSSGYTSAEATTNGEQTQGLELSASGYKVKGVHHISLQWTGAGTVDVYRDGIKVASGAAGSSYDYSIGRKGGATYEHHVCESGGDTNCSNVTTTTF